MGQKTNPISNRLGIIRGWDSNWYGGDNYGNILVEDAKIRKYLNVRLAKASLSRIVIERTLKLVTITICTARLGAIVGRGGQDIEQLKEELKKITEKDVEVNIFEVRRPDLDAQIVANNVARQIEGKMAYRRAVKLAIQNTMKTYAEGIKIQVSGRLNGAEIARSEMFKEGRTPLHTFRADIDYCRAEALTKVGIIGIKVWICRGEIFGKKDLAPHFPSYKENSFGERKDGGRGGNRGDRNDRGDRGRGRSDGRGERNDRGGDRNNSGRSERNDNRGGRNNNNRGDRNGGFRRDKK